MGLYLCVFKDDEELEGVEVGLYEYFGLFRDSVVTFVENDAAGSVCPTLVLHSDCDGEWSSIECKQLLRELATIAYVFKNLPSHNGLIDIRRNQFLEPEINPTSLYDCFVDVDGVNLIERIMGLCSIAILNNERIMFQ